MIRFATGLDVYEQRARLIPGLVAGLPLALLSAELGFSSSPLYSLLMSMLVAIGIPFIVTSWVRFQGLAVQKRLVAEWNGMPTVRWLRLNDEGFGSRREVWRDAMNRLSKKPFPDKAAELADTADADQIYAGATAIARERTRDPKLFPLVLMENSNYGLERNLLGFQPVGIAVSWLCLAADVVILGAAVLGRLSLPAGAWVAPTVLIILLAFWWTLYPSQERVKEAGERYAERLFDSMVASER